MIIMTTCVRIQTEIPATLYFFHELYYRMDCNLGDENTNNLLSHDCITVTVPGYFITS